MSNVAVHDPIRTSPFWDDFVFQYDYLSYYPISITELFPAIARFSEGLAPSKYMPVSDRNVELFAKKYGIWLQNFSKGSHNMTGYLHPSTIGESRLTTLGNFYTLLFTIDDTITANVKAEIDQKGMYELQEFTEVLVQYLAGKSDVDIHRNRLAAAAIAIINDLIDINHQDYLSGQSEAANWINKFKVDAARHLDQARRNDNTEVRGRPLTVDEFMDKRIHDSGMRTTILLMPVSVGQYLPEWGVSEGTDILLQLLKLQQELCMLIAALVNDYFSLHKEVRVALSDFNLITVLMRNYKLDLMEALKYGALLIDDYFLQYQQNGLVISQLLRNYSEPKSFMLHLQNLDEAIQATWVWEMSGTNRYRAVGSIFSELTD